jgi:hypothetical protein
VRKRRAIERANDHLAGSLSANGYSRRRKGAADPCLAAVFHSQMAIASNLRNEQHFRWPKRLKRIISASIYKEKGCRSKCDPKSCVG